MTILGEEEEEEDGMEEVFCEDWRTSSLTSPSSSWPRLTVCGWPPSLSRDSADRVGDTADRVSESAAVVAALLGCSSLVSDTLSLDTGPPWPPLVRTSLWPPSEVPMVSAAAPPSASAVFTGATGPPLSSVSSVTTAAGASRHRRPGTSHPRAWPSLSLILPVLGAALLAASLRHMSPQ